MSKYVPIQTMWESCTLSIEDDPEEYLESLEIDYMAYRIDAPKRVPVHTAIHPSILFNELISSHLNVLVMSPDFSDETCEDYGFPLSAFFDAISLANFNNVSYEIPNSYKSVAFDLYYLFYNPKDFVVGTLENTEYEVLQAISGDAYTTPLYKKPIKFDIAILFEKYNPETNVGITRKERPLESIKDILTIRINTNALYPNNKVPVWGLNRNKINILQNLLLHPNVEPYSVPDSAVKLRINYSACLISKGRELVLPYPESNAYMQDLCCVLSHEFCHAIEFQLGTVLPREKAIKFNPDEMAGSNHAEYSVLTIFQCVLTPYLQDFINKYHIDVDFAHSELLQLQSKFWDMYKIRYNVRISPYLY